MAGIAALLPSGPPGMVCSPERGGRAEEAGSQAVKLPLGPVWLAAVGRAITLPSNKNSSDVEIGNESRFVACNLLLSP